MTALRTMSLVAPDARARGGASAASEARGRHPDIKDGFLVNRVNDTNSWQTPILALLQGPQGTSALAAPCRHERVSDEGIFRPWRFETMICSVWGTPYILRSGAALHHPMWRKKSAGDLYEERPDGHVAVNAPLRRIVDITLDDALATLQAGERAEFYMVVSWDGYELTVPCRYVNYPPRTSDRKYVQPITGYALFPDDPISVAYVACHVTKSGSTTEFQLRRPVSMKTLLRQRVGMWNRIGMAALSVFPWSLSARVDEFSDIRQVEAQVRLFRYE